MIGRNKRKRYLFYSTLEIYSKSLLRKSLKGFKQNNWKNRAIVIINYNRKESLKIQFFNKLKREFDSRNKFMKDKVAQVSQISNQIKKKLFMSIIRKKFLLYKSYQNRVI